MKRRILANLALVATASAWEATDAAACGDKFLVVGRGVRSQRTQGAVRRASILIYNNPSTRMPAAVAEARLERELTLAGHRLSLVTSPAAVEGELESGRHDVVLADLSDMAAVEAQVKAAGSRAVLLPVVYNPTDEELAAAEQRYRCVMKAPSRRHHFLGVLNDALVERSRRRTR